MKKQKLLSIILSFSIVFSIVFISSAPKAQATWPTFAIPNFVPEVFTSTTGATTLAQKIAQTLLEATQSIALVGLKIAHLKLVQTLTKALIGSDSEGGAGVVTNWNTYLYVSPQQQAMAKMNSFFSTVSRGRLSSLNYEGVSGKNYDQYMATEALREIEGQAFTTNLQEQASDPTKLFAAGNSKALLTYMQCANNVACYTLTATAKYNAEFEKNQTIAKNEQDKGFLPTKKNGVISRPASIVSGAFEAMDKMGTDLIMSADLKANFAAGEAQMLGGVAISTISRGFNYAASSDAGKAALRNSNDASTAFSVAYSSKDGFGVNVAGTTISSGVNANTFSSAASKSICAGDTKTLVCCQVNGGKWVNGACANK